MFLLLYRIRKVRIRVMERRPNSEISIENASWEELAQNAQNGDRRAYNKLLQNLASYTKSILGGSLANPEWVDDITQDVLVSVHKSLDTYSSERPFKPWVRSIIQFRKADFLRQHYKKKHVNESAFEHTEIFQEDVTFQPDYGELKDIDNAISTFPEKQQKIFKLLKIEGYSAKEVAEKMDMSESAVKVSAHRTANKLKEILG